MKKDYGWLLLIAIFVTCCAVPDLAPVEITKINDSANTTITLPNNNIVLSGCIDDTIPYNKYIKAEMDSFYSLGLNRYYPLNRLPKRQIIYSHTGISEPTNQCEADALLRVNTINGTDSIWYHNGEIIYPDYVQQDTLVVVNAQFLNKNIILGDAKSDGDIYECLQEGCVQLADYADYIRTSKH